MPMESRWRSCSRLLCLTMRMRLSQVDAVHRKHHSALSSQPSATAFIGYLRQYNAFVSSHPSDIEWVSGLKQLWQSTVSHARAGF